MFKLYTISSQSSEESLPTYFFIDFCVFQISSY